MGVEGGLPERDFYASNPNRGTALGGAAANPAARTAPPAAAAQTGGPERPCRICATPNPPGLRYCTSCGSTLEPVVTAAVSAPRMLEPAPTAPAPAPAYGSLIAPAPAPFAATAAPYGNNPMPAPVPFGGHADPPPAPQGAVQGSAVAIAPMRVVDLGGSPRPTHDAPRMCARCQGVVDSAAQFCKFCGASLGDGAQASLAAQPSEPSLPELAAHERVSLPRTNGQPAPAPAHRPPTVPMNAATSGDLPFPVDAPPAYAPPPPPPVVAPAPAPTRRAEPTRVVTRGRLVVIAKSGADGPSYPFGDTLDVGRTEGQIIVGEDPYLSPRHVRVAWTGSKLVLRDLASTNGVYLRLVGHRDMLAEAAKKAGPAPTPADPRVPGEVAVPLIDQDLILVGQQVLRFELVNDGEVGFGPATEHGTLLFGSPAAPRYARLSQRTVEGVTRDVYYVRKAETVLGRESGDVVFTEDPFLSRRHAAIRVVGCDGAPITAGIKPPAEGVTFALVDLGSSNGSFLRIRNEVELVPGDHFRVGQQLFRVDFGGGE